jgi:hypothetical protein
MVNIAIRGLLYAVAAVLLALGCVLYVVLLAVSVNAGWV